MRCATWCAYALLLAHTACWRGSRTPADPTMVKFVSSLPRTGSANSQSTTIVNGIRMAIQEAQGQAGPYRIVYEDWDDASTRKGDWDPEVEAANASRAANDINVMVYLGPFNSGAAKISMPILNAANLPMISVASYPGLTKPGTGELTEPAVYRPTGKVNFFRIDPADDIQGRLAAQWVQSMGGKKVYVLDDLGLYGRGLAEVFIATAEDIGLTVLGHDSIDPKAQEYRSLMARIKNLHPDWLYFGGTTQTNAGQVAKDMVASGLNAKLMLPDASLEQAFIQAAGASNVNGRAYFTFGGVTADRLTGAGAGFAKRYRQKYGNLPEPYAIYGYVSTQAAIDAVRRAGQKDREAVRRALFNTQQVDGALGSWSFDTQGDSTLHIMSGTVVRNGTFEFVKLLGQ